jgi:GTPase SAR1 family protein
MTSGSWLIPVAKEAWKHRQEIHGVWQRIMTRLRRTRGKLAFTGMAGVGKTVLLDHLAGTAFRQGYRPPGKSEAPETGKLVVPARQIALTVVPGQDSSPRHEALDALFLGKTPMTGVVHVVANGLATVRDRDAETKLIVDGHDTVRKFQTLQRKAELLDLDETCRILRQALRKHRKPFWMVVAVAKVDLYQADIDQAEAIYSPTATGEFAARLHDLAGQVGTDNFRWAAYPVCSWPEDFAWNGKTLRSTLKTPERDHYLAGFAEVIEGYSRGAK